MQDIVKAQGHGVLTVEFLREEQRVSAHGIGSSRQAAASQAAEVMKLSRCILRIVDGPHAGLEVEDRSRSSLSAPGTRLIATVRAHSRYAGFARVN
jgi:hypothetical protein